MKAHYNYLVETFLATKDFFNQSFGEYLLENRETASLEGFKKFMEDKIDNQVKSLKKELEYYEQNS